MNSHLKIIFQYLKFLLNARSFRTVHSPFVFSFCYDVLRKDEEADKALFQKIHYVKKKIYSDRNKILISDIKTHKEIKREVQIGKHARRISQPHKTGKILFRTVRKMNPANIIELGTGLGIGTMYLAAANPDTPVITIESKSNVSQIAKSVINESGFSNIRCLTGRFVDVLPEVLSENIKIDFVFIDGDHNKESVHSYIQMFKPYLNDDSLVILHDINWSDDMQQCWNEIVSSPDVTVSIDTFFFGFLFFRKSVKKQHFKIRF